MSPVGVTTPATGTGKPIEPAKVLVGHAEIPDAVASTRNA